MKPRCSTLGRRQVICKGGKLDWTLGKIKQEMTKTDMGAQVTVQLYGQSCLILFFSQVKKNFKCPIL